MRIHYTKDSLYKEVVRIKSFFNLSEAEYSFDLIDLCVQKGLLIKSIPFKTKGLRGMACIGESKSTDVVLLNNTRNREERNFDCGHEIMHLSLHREIGSKSFNCFDNVAPTQDSFLEWHANEGSAEMFVPYKALLPIIESKLDEINTVNEFEHFKEFLSFHFKVPEIVITYRLENLRYEIHQYNNGVSLEEIELLSNNQLKERNIDIKSLNQLFQEKR
ncbi:ImmA/IrrE family metallo-endopeptidase [Anaerosacchariphilus polymeriproducens]|uniref:ImmA/IrrE family metallo-endopeptidase n=1 Tax=Anaerosacchariphilus polymeriproducens TaxID=1812858 RepID=A0A371AUE0_9FIRM|nr:ImmA/IrrE family metallo-endopeptidase [Anaerosacchariphilus polymeriproducens]RDU23186.1 ImmA/IrrE family metallo-endopeptidase [Anaerosacchariphilus polymeriproducens]